MAVVNVKALPVSNSDAVPRVPNASYFQNGAMREDVGVVAITNGDSIASTFRMARISSSSRVAQVLLSNAAVATAAADIGLYRTAADGGAVVDADFFASAAALTAAQHGIDVTYEAGVVTIANHGKRVWEQLGLTADPMIDYDVAFTLTAAATGTGDASLKVRYVDGA
jgi:hypothetical protein